MKRSVLIITSGDPEGSGRPAEALRVAAGLSAHERLAVTLCLVGPARRILRAEQEALVEGDTVAEFLDVLKQSGGRVLAEVGSGDPATTGTDFVTRAEIDRLVAESERVISF